jgi:hypothetical protein
MPLDPRLLRNIEQDLEPYRKTGIDRALFDRVNGCAFKGLHIKIIDGEATVFREAPSFQTRNHCMVLMLREVASRYPLPDCEFIIHTDDVPPVSNLPLFTFCKRAGDKTILVPDFSFYAWLEAYIPNIDEAKRYVARGHMPWKEKTDKLFFAGAGTHPLRIAMGRMNDPFLDIRITDWTRNRASFVTLQAHNRWRYLLHLAGNSYSARLKYLFLTNSLVIQGDNEWREFWHPILEEGVHCIKHDFGDGTDLNSLRKKLSDLSEEDVQRIIQAGHQHVSQILTLDNIYEYMARLIEEYAALLRFKIQRHAYKLVIARYNEDISWSNGLPRIIYNKGEKIEGIPEDEQIMVPNVGRESNTYLDYIIDNYKDLPEHVLFCQGRIDDHLGRHTIHSYVNPDYDFITGRFCNLREWDPATGRLMHFGPWLERLQNGRMRPAKLSFVEWFEKVLRIPMGETVCYTPGAIFCVAARNIRKRHVGFYQKLSSFVCDHADPEEGHYLERSWFYIFVDKDIKLLTLD